ncbi:MAG: Com family DNA-binding transcriptional regulator [Proteobacteria bacterium]|nr:Com family DNA-binding transcriptional regulator [Pseudomonadota bacterium]
MQKEIRCGNCNRLLARGEDYVLQAALASVPHIDVGPGPLYLDGVACCRSCQY